MVLIAANSVPTSIDRANHLLPHISTAGARGTH
jgi:hypothetical protein